MPDKSIRIPSFVIPAKAGIQALQSILGPGLRRGDGTSIGHSIPRTRIEMMRMG